MASSSTNQSCRICSLKENKSATKNFRDDRILGKGGFATVYLGIINGEKVAVKQLIKVSSQKGMGFDEEIQALTQIKHRNIVSLIGYCNKDGEKILVYEYIDNHTLNDHLHKRLRDGHSELSWDQRLTILIGVARALYHLHYCIGIGSFIHRDVKSSNILLDKNLVAKVADFGLAKYVSFDDELSHIITDGKGTFGYMDPYYIYTGKLTKDSDKYSFGMVMLEVLGKKKEAMDILDPVFHGNITEGRLKAVDICCDICKKCLLPPKERPEMSLVLAQLELALHTSDSDSENVNPMPAIAHLAIPHSDLKEMTPIDSGSRGSTIYWSTIPATRQKVALKI
ncbi:probable receptor-like protein kinase At4g39110 [Salvia splendens]|uniref:probable receptor-like protein kinase At4g39110 n=1 Tax=Salvia splendens TaxID=180675 RepID=UPI001C262F7F|nr:probable receptor-like protein kinase At4g39110 [Salvia splendens]